MTQTLLAIGAHCDDCIIGMPGILLKAVRSGYRVVILALIGDFENWPPAARMQGRGEELRNDTVALCRDFGAELRYLDFKTCRGPACGVPYAEALRSGRSSEA